MIEPGSQRANFYAIRTWFGLGEKITPNFFLNKITYKTIETTIFPHRTRLACTNQGPRKTTFTQTEPGTLQKITPLEKTQRVRVTGGG